ncbi:glycosyltransferase family 2 protein [Acinetobacter sp. A2]|uniref:glycosyltransferase family 2 protein n=1 Tax=Acinetobacter sp. A2 TaxID=362457 RepID=UPI0014467ADE|nr:glycosyltransferase family 2 protein [Acinetobacter sp. A2]
MNYADLTVIIPCYNSSQTIIRCLDSIKNQTLLPEKIIVVDDCSHDNTLDILKEYKKYNSKLNLEIFELNKNSGPSFARNLGVKSASSAYIAFLDSDDVWVRNKLEIQYKSMLDNDLNFSFHLYSAFPSIIVKDCILKKVTLFDLAKRQIICTPTVMVKKNILKDFNTDMRFCEDFLCWVMSNNNNNFYYIDSYLANGFKKQYGESGLSSNMREMHLGVLKAFKILYYENYINLWSFILFSAMEHVKYPIRILRSKSVF